MTTKRIIFVATIALYLVPFLLAQTAKQAAKPLPYSIQVERIDSKVEAVPAEFNAAIYENLIEELTKSGRFEQVFRSGDKRASGATTLLTLKTTVEKFQQGSETTRAVTTVGGATHVYVQMVAAGPDGKPVVDKNVEGTVRFFGANLRATQRLASSMAKQLEQSLTAQNVAKK